MHYFVRNIVKLQTTFRSAVSAFSIRLYITPSRWWDLPSINLGNGPVRLKVQGSLWAGVIPRKQSQLVSLHCCYSCLRQFYLFVMPGKPKKVCIVGSGNWWVYESFYNMRVYTPLLVLLFGWYVKNIRLCK
jgi:hypothetical protein